MSVRTKNILTAVLAVVLVGGFIFLAEGLKKDNKNPQLEALENITTTTVRRTTTSSSSTTSTSTTTPSTSTTLAAVVTTTTAKKTTTTVKSTGTTRRTTTTVSNFAAVPHNGVGTETADNNPVSFTRNADGSYSTSTAPACSTPNNTDPFCFNIGTEGGLKLVVEVRNNTNRTIHFPQGTLKISVTINNPNGTQSQFVMDASPVDSLGPREGARISSSTQFTDAGQYSFTASCEIDYGS